MVIHTVLILFLDYLYWTPKKTEMYEKQQELNAFCIVISIKRLKKPNLHPILGFQFSPFLV